MDDDAPRTAPARVDAINAVGVQLGDHNIQQIIHGSARDAAAVSWPVQVGTVPLAANCFQPRPRFELTAIVTAGTTVVLTEAASVHVLSGLGGVGKSQLAAHYVRTVLDDAGDPLDLLIWVTADTRTAIFSAYAAAYAKVTGTVAGDGERAATWLLEWLAGTRRRWLVVLDDVQSPADLNQLWPPATPTGRTLVTTRRRDDALRGDRRQIIDVDVFTPAESGAYLRGRLGHRPAALEQHAALAADLGHLPLALAQAATYIADAHLTCAQYRTRLAERRTRLADLLPKRDALPDEHTATVAATWSLSIELADRLEPRGLARPLLTLAALLDPNGIPFAVLTARAVLAHLARHRSAGADPDAVRRTLATLHRLSLATVNPDEPSTSVRVHALVQRVTRDRLAPAELAARACVVADALLDTWPPIERDTALCQVLRANTNALHATTFDALWAMPAPARGWRRLTRLVTRRRPHHAHPVLFRSGASLGNVGQVRAAVDYYAHLEATSRRRFGVSHEDTLTAAHELAFWRGQAGDAAGAVAAFGALLAQHHRVLGPEHPDTLATRANLARWRGEAGDAAGAADAMQQVLDEQVRVLGPEHSDTLATRHELAFWRAQAGDSAGIISDLQDLLLRQERALGPDHPSTLATQANLARWHGEAGDAAGAADAMQRVLDDQLRVLGPDHPETLTARHELAFWRGRAGAPAEAAAAFRALLDDQLRILGPDHPDTLRTRHEIAFWKGQLGDPAGAAAAFTQLLADRLRILGPAHPQTLATRANLARWRGEAGDSAGAALAMEQLLEDRQRILGPDHPHTLATKANLARWLKKSGRFDRAFTIEQEVLSDRHRIRQQQRHRAVPVAAPSRAAADRAEPSALWLVLLVLLVLAAGWWALDATAAT